MDLLILRQSYCSWTHFIEQTCPITSVPLSILMV